MICVFIDFLDAKLEITGSESTINLSESKTIPAVVLKSNDSSINKSPTNKKNRNSEPEFKKISSLIKKCKINNCRI